MIRQLDGFSGKAVGFSCHGQVTRRDYDTVLIPAVEQALAAHDKVRVYYETAPDFTGYDPGAMWADASVGVSHLPHWERVAVVSDVEWLRLAVGGFAFLMPALVRLFPGAEAAQARAWIAEG